jgi:hypothetical protein
MACVLAFIVLHCHLIDKYFIPVLHQICHAQVLQRLPKHGKGAYCVLQKLDSFANVLVMYRSIYQMMEVTATCVTAFLNILCLVTPY